MRNGDPGVLLVPRVGIRQERGRGVTIMVTGALTGVRPLIAVGTVAPRRRAIVPIPKAASAVWDCPGGVGCTAAGAWLLAPRRSVRLR